MIQSREITLSGNLYNMVNGTEPTADIVLTMLNFDSRKIARLRDAYITFKDDTKTEPVLVIMTRTGGGNRPSYESSTAMLRNHPAFLDDADDKFDPTFALFRYRVDEKYHLSFLRYLIINGAPKSLFEKTDAIASAIASGGKMTERNREGLKVVYKELKPLFE